MGKIIKRLIVLSCVLVLTGCMSTDMNKQCLTGRFDFISAKCKVGDEIEIGYPVPVEKVYKGLVFGSQTFYRYNFRKRKWECIAQPKLYLGTAAGGIAFNFFRKFDDKLRSKFVKIKILKEGLFLIRTEVEIKDSSKDNKVIYSIETSTILDSRGER